jgi:hypothetical protein
MSEAVDAEREVEDFFNKEIFGAPPRAENEAPFPTETPPETPPEPKPVEEVVVDDAPEEKEEKEEPPPEVTEPVEGAEETPPEQDKEPPIEVTATEEDEVAAWAKKKFGDDVALDTDSEKKFAKAAFEQEKLLGKQAEQARVDREAREQMEVQQRIDALNTPGSLTPEEDTWVGEALISSDPGEWAYNALQAERPDLYATIMDRWAALGEDESRRARVFHSRVLQAVTAPQPTEQESYTAALGNTFISLGLSIEEHGPVLLAKAEELGAANPLVQGMMSPNDDVRRISTRAIYDLVAAGRATVSKARTDDVVDQRVKEEQLRQNAAGVERGGPRVEQPPKSPFWEKFDEELAERGWDGNRPNYGKE